MVTSSYLINSSSFQSDSLTHPLIGTKEFEHSSFIGKFEASTVIERFEKIERILSTFTVKNPFEVYEFLSDNPEILNSLLMVYGKIKRLVGYSTNLYLVYDYDPDENYKGLTIEIESCLLPEKVVELLDEFDEWFISNVHNNIRESITVTGKFNGL